jgi:hypothetical protein
MDRGDDFTRRGNRLEHELPADNRRRSRSAILSCERRTLSVPRKQGSIDLPLLGSCHGDSNCFLADPVAEIPGVARPKHDEQRPLTPPSCSDGTGMRRKCEDYRRPAAGVFRWLDFAPLNGRLLRFPTTFARHLNDVYRGAVRQW